MLPESYGCDQIPRLGLHLDTMPMSGLDHYALLVEQLVNRRLGILLLRQVRYGGKTFQCMSKYA